MRSLLLVILVALIGIFPVGCSSPEERAAAYLEKAQQLYDEEDYTTARIEAMNAAQIEPRNADVRYLLAEIEEKEQNFRQAVGHLQVAVDANEYHLPSRIKLGNYYILAKALDEADEQTTAAEQIDPENAEVMLLRARVMYLREDVDGALAQIEKTLAQDPSLIEATMFKSGVYVSREQYDEALDLVDAAIGNADTDAVEQLRQFRVILLRSASRDDAVEAELKSLMQDYPEEDSYAVTLAQLYVTQGKVEDAESILRKIVDAEPDNADKRIDFVRFVAEQRGTEAAEAVLEEFVTELPESMDLKLALGRFRESQQENDSAYSIYNEIAQAEPTSEIGLTARNRMVALKIRGNELDEAKDMIAGILEVEPDNADSLLVRSAFSFTDRDYDAAIADLRTVLRSDPESTRALLLLARSHVGAGSAELAQDAYRRLIEVAPDHPNASNELADLLARTGDADQAEEVLRRKLEVSPDDRRSASNLVEALLLQGETDAAEEEVRDMVALDDPSGLAEFQLGRVMQAKQSSDEAVAAYKKALEKNPAAFQALQGLTTTLVDDGRTDEAITLIKDYIAANPEQAGAKLLLGTAYARNKNVEAAKAAFEDVIASNPDANRAYASLAALSPQDQDERIRIYRRGIDANPDDATLAFLLASEYERAADWDKAIEIYDSLVVADDANDLAANNLAALLLDHRTDADSHARALELAKRFEDNDQPALVDTLGWAYYRNGDFANAVRYLELAVNKAGEIPQLRYHLGMAYLANRNSIRAREELQIAVDTTTADFIGLEEARATLAQIDSES
ncbi:MAG: tetratricopeptide repeat protein [Gammaproteobacteria bacterium]